MNERLANYLLILRNSIYKLLPMKEETDDGNDNHINEYIDSLIINIDGAADAYPILISQRKYLWVINNLQYLKNNEVRFSKWRSIILNSTSAIDNLYRLYKGDGDDGWL